MSAGRACVWFWTASAVVAPWFVSHAARAQAPLFASTWSEEAKHGVAQATESPELRELRVAEEELFGGGSERAPEEAYDPDCVYGVPDALTSNVPPPHVERADGAVVDLAFLTDVKLPDLPVRWDPRVVDYLLFFKNDPRGRDLARAWLQRIDRYGPVLRRVLREHSLPEDLEIVAMVESGYDPLARSAVGALGVWQFVKQSGQFYGLRIDHWVDERLDPERATYASARYMRDLYDRFGSWELAFAAYNMGYGSLLRALRKYNTNDYWLLSHLEAGLPFETSIYVAKITALAIVANNPDRFGLADLTREAHVPLTAVDVPAGTPLRAIASAANIDVELLKTYNHHLLRGRTPPGEPSARVYVPREAYERFAQRWSKNHEPALHVGYTVRFGESLEDVARRFALSPARLREINELGKDEPVRAGFALLVPATAEIKTQNGEQLVATVPEKQFHYDDRRRVFYRVAANDTPPAVARFFDVTVDELAAWNNITAEGALQRDMLLQVFVSPALDLGRAVVFTPDQVRVLTLGSDEFYDFHEAQRGRVRVRYRVQSADTVAKIAERFELSAGSVARINQFATNKELKVNDWVVVYVPEKQIPELERKKLIERVSARGASSATPAAVSASKPKLTPAPATLPALPVEDTATPPADEEPSALPPDPAPAVEAEAAAETEGAGVDGGEAQVDSPAQQAAEETP